MSSDYQKLHDKVTVCPVITRNCMIRLLGDKVTVSPVITRNCVIR